MKNNYVFVLFPNFSGIFKPGMNAILGPTGSGKSSSVLYVANLELFLIYYQKRLQLIFNKDIYSIYLKLISTTNIYCRYRSTIIYYSYLSTTAPDVYYRYGRDVSINIMKTIYNWAAWLNIGLLYMFSLV